MLPLSMMELPDVQSWKPQSKFKLTRVGIKGVKKQLQIRRPNRVVTLVATMDLFVDLPASRKGSDLSRNSEVIEEIIDESTIEPSPSLESLCARIAQSLLKRHEYATNSEVRAEADYFLERFTPNKKRTMEPYKLISRAIANRNGELKKMIGVEVMGMTTCPCAMEMIRRSYGLEMPTITHNQRNICRLMIQSNGDVDADDLIKICEDAMSSPSYEILKREDEREVVMMAHKNPKFVEDVVRDILKEILKKYRNLPDDTLIIVRSESLESIHKHNAFAERETTLGELRK
jgi:GTP cyclohydrolase-4